MMKKLLLIFALGASSLTYAQWSQDFEGDEPTFVSRPAPTCVAAVAANPETSGINTSSKALQITLTSGAPAFKWVGIENLGGTYNASNGNFIKFKFLSVNSTDVSIQLEPWFDGSVYTTLPAKTFNNIALNTWYEVEFDYSTLGITTAGYCTRLDLKFNFTPGVAYNGDVFYVDDMTQEANSTLSNVTYKFSNFVVYPNPTSHSLFLKTTDVFEFVKIYNVLGNEVKTFQNSKEINVSGLASGLYILKTNTGFQTKFVKN